MNDRNRYHEPICEFSDLPIAMCAHCSGKTGNPEPILMEADIAALTAWNRTHKRGLGSK